MMRRQNFTMIELLVVIVIIAILAAMLLPALNRAKETALNINCLNLVKQLGSCESFYQQDNHDYMTPTRQHGVWRNADGSMRTSVDNKSWYHALEPYARNIFWRKAKNSATQTLSVPWCGGAERDSGNLLLDGGSVFALWASTGAASAGNGSYGSYGNGFQNTVGYWTTSSGPAMIKGYKITAVRNPSQKVGYIENYYYGPYQTDYWDLLFRGNTWTRHYRGQQRVNTAFVDGHVGAIERCLTANEIGGVSVIQYYISLK